MKAILLAVGSLPLLCVAAVLSAAESAGQFTTAAGFRAELVYRVPRESQGSWVALTKDPQGRFIASDQKGGLYRVTVDAGREAAVEPIDLAIGRAHGLLCAFDSLYVVVAEDAYDGPGLYRVRDTDGDDRYDQVQLLKNFAGTGEHGPHSVVLAPDGQSLFVIAGNKTPVLADFESNSLVPRHWGEDDLLPRIWGPIGSEAGTPAPGGWIAKTDPDGSRWELQAVGLRNGFDLAFNEDGVLFTVDADAEFDLGTPWYQPTRLFHVVPGTDFGWRSGSGKWPPYFPDTLPPVTELGAGSPTGLAFGYETAFPERYRRALFVGDWSQGRIVAVHLSPEGATYRGDAELIVSGKPLPVTDLIGSQADGAIYFTVGGRGATSGLYRLVYDAETDRPGSSTVGVTRDAGGGELELRRELSWLESVHQLEGGAEERRVWSSLSHADRSIRHAARLVLERTPAEVWQDRALGESGELARLTALLGLARAGDDNLLPQIVELLVGDAQRELDNQARVAQLRCLKLVFIRDDRGLIGEKLRGRVRSQLESQFPTGDARLDGELCKLLVFLGSPFVTHLAVERLTASLTQQERLRFALPLRHQAVGWDPSLRKAFFSLLGEASAWRGGLSLQKYVERIGQDALAHLPTDQAPKYRDLLQRQVETEATAETNRPVVREWSLADLTPLEAGELEGRNLRRGRQLFAAANCFACHRFQAEGGGVGPDLTTVAKRFSPADLLEAIVEPSKVVSDQFAASTIVMVDGRVLTGRVVNLVGDTLLVQTDMLDAAKLERLPRQDIDEMGVAQTSMMPAGLLNTLTRSEILDLLGFFVADGAATGSRPQTAD